MSDETHFCILIIPKSTPPRYSSGPAPGHLLGLYQSLLLLLSVGFTRHRQTQQIPSFHCMTQLLRLGLGHSETPTANSCSDCPSFSLGCVLYAKMRHLCTGLAEHSSGRSGWVSPGKHLSSPPAMLSAWLKLGDVSSILQKDDFSTFIKSWGSLSVGSW